MVQAIENVSWIILLSFTEIYGSKYCVHGDDREIDFETGNNALQNRRPPETQAIYSEMMNRNRWLIPAQL